MIWGERHVEAERHSANGQPLGKRLKGPLRQIVDRDTDSVASARDNVCGSDKASVSDRLADCSDDEAEYLHG